MTHVDHDPATCSAIGCKQLACKLAAWRRHPSAWVSPAATPSRRNNAPPRRPNASWEAGIARDHRGMPLLDPVSLEPIGVKEAAAYRHRWEQNRLTVSTKE